MCYYEILDTAQSLITSIQFDIAMNLLSIALFSNTWILILIIQSSDQGMSAGFRFNLIANVYAL